MFLKSMNRILVRAESGYLTRISFEGNNYQLLALKRENRVWDGELSRFKKRGLLGVKLSVASEETMLVHDYFIFGDKTFSSKAVEHLSPEEMRAAGKSYNGKMT